MGKFNMILTCVLLIVSTFEISAFLLEDKTPLPNNGLTDKHYIAVMDLLLEERKERQNLEIAMTQLHQELLAKTSGLPKLNSTNCFFEKCNAELQGSKNKTDKILDELNAENTKLKQELSYLRQSFSNLQLEMRLKLNQFENKSIDDMNRVQNDLNSLKQLKAIDQLQDVQKLQNQFEDIQHQVQSLTSIQSARGQDVLALYNQTLGIKSSLKQSMVDLSNNHTDSMTQLQTVLIKANLTTYEIKKELGNEVSQLKQHIQEEKLANLTNILLKKQMDIEINRLQQKIADENLARGITYVRWSRKQCPNNKTELVYSGYAGGGKYDEPGSSAEPVCLPKDPDFVNTFRNGNRGNMYGAEFSGDYFASNSVNQDVPCAVCRVKQASSVIMIPGKNRCYTGWIMEYNGYLASNYYNDAAAGSYVCIDIQPEYVSGGSSWNGNSKLFFKVVANCGSLRCPPYKANYQLTCVVCSK